MLDYLTANIAFWMTLFGVQESLLEFRLGYLGRYWFLAISASLFIGFLLSALITVPLIINLTVDPFTFPGNLILSGIAAFIFGVILTSSQWLILRETHLTPRVFALINTVIGILVYFLLVWLNEGTLEWSGNPIGGWKTALIFLAGGAITGGVTGKALDFYCELVERRLIQLERERVETETKNRERIETEIRERENLEMEILERKRISREIALEEERKWYEEHGDDDFDYEDALLFSHDSQIKASSQLGANGIVQINGLYSQLEPTKAAPESIPVVPQITSVCQGHSNITISKFVNVGTGGLPANSDDIPYMNSEQQNNSVAIHKNNNLEASKSSQTEEPTQIVEAQGWIINLDGNVVLTAQKNTATPNSSSSALACR